MSLGVECGYPYQLSELRYVNMYPRTWSAPVLDTSQMLAVVTESVAMSRQLAEKEC